MQKQTPTRNVPRQDAEEPLGDRGKGDKTWSPEQGEQGISNREGDEDPDAEIDEEEDAEGFDEDEGEDPSKD